MRSFGLWYQPTEQDNSDRTGNPKFSIHINFWSESIKKNDSLPDLDIGIKIENFLKAKEIVFHCPFFVETNEIVDLAEKISKKENANLVFNCDGEIRTLNRYSIYEFEEREKKNSLLIFPLNQNTPLGQVYTVEHNDEKTNIRFDFSKFQQWWEKQIENTDKLPEIKTIYIRFRIKSDKLKDGLYFDNDPLNKSFESAFSGTRIIDFKMNERRNLGNGVLENIRMENWFFPELDKVHFLIMEKASYHIEPFAGIKDKMVWVACRELEGQRWRDYYDYEMNQQGHFLAYHWRFIGEDSCSCLVKVDYSKTNMSIIITYILVVVILGTLGSILGSITLETVHGIRTDSPVTYVVFGFLIFCIGFILGGCWKDKGS